MSYRIARGEQGVLTFEPYKSILLPHWRFKTIPIATQSSQTLFDAFEHYVKAGDLVGADMARKFIQMGMTRAKRYANYKGGRKYDRTARKTERDGGGGGGGGERRELPRSEVHEGREEKLGASDVFKEVWKRCTSDERYLKLKNDFVMEKEAWERSQAEVKKSGEDKDSKSGEDHDEAET